MALTNRKITSTDISTKGVIAAPDKLTGTAAENKAIFDRLVREVVKDVVNGLVDDLTAASGASEIGFTAITGLGGDNIQAAVALLKTIVDTKASDSEMEADLALKADKSVTNLHIKDVAFNPNNGVFTFTKENGSTITFDTALEKVVTNFEYDPNTQSLVLHLADGSTQNIPLSAFITETEFSDSTTISFSVQNHVVSAAIKSGSITDEMLSSVLIEQLQEYVSNAETSATAAAGSATNAETYKGQAQSAKNDAISAKEEAQAYKTAAETAKTDAETAKEAAEAAAASATTIVENVNNIILSDLSLENTKWVLSVDNGALVITQVSSTLTTSDVTFIDQTTGKTYKPYVDNGVFGIEEV